MASTTWGDSGIDIRDTQTGQKLQRITVAGGVGGLAFSPDASMIAIGGSSAIWLWDVKNNTLLSYLGPQSSAIGALAFSHDGKRLVSVGDDAAQLWDLNSREALKTIRLSRNHLYWGATVSPRNPDFFAISFITNEIGEDTMEVWDIESESIIMNIDVFSAPATSATISPDGRFVAVTRNPHTEIWDIASGKVVYQFQPNRSVFAFSSDGRRLVVSDLNGAVELWDINQLK